MIVLAFVIYGLIAAVWIKFLIEEMNGNTIHSFRKPKNRKEKIGNIFAYIAMILLIAFFFACGYLSDGWPGAIIAGIIYGSWTVAEIIGVSN